MSLARSYLVAFLATLASLTLGCSRTCETPGTSGPGLTGTFSYTSGDGVTIDGVLDDASSHVEGSDAILIAGSFTDLWGAERDYEIAAHDLAPSPGPVDVHGDFCLARSAGAEPVCSDLTGTIDIRQLSRDCSSHESGASSCIETMDFTLSAGSAWQGTDFEIAAEMLRIGNWESITCD